FQAEDGIRDRNVTGVQTCALPISRPAPEIWATATRSRAPVFASALLGAPKKPAKRKRAKPPTARSVPCRQTACSRISSGPDGWRSEERRVGKEGGWGGRQENEEKK